MGTYGEGGLPEDCGRHGRCGRGDVRDVTGAGHGTRPRLVSARGSRADAARAPPASSAESRKAVADVPHVPPPDHHHSHNMLATLAVRRSIARAPRATAMPVAARFYSDNAFK